MLLVATRYGTNMRQKSLWAKAAIGVILLAVSFAIVTGSAANPVYAASLEWWRLGW